MAWVSDEPMIYDKLTPFEYLEFVAGLWGIEPALAEARANDLIGWLGLDAARPRALRGLLQGHAAEGGARRRAGARAAADHPRRAADRPRRRLRAPGQERAARAGRGRRHRHHDHAHPRSRRAHGRPHRRDRRRPADRAGHARRTARSRPARAIRAWRTRSSRWSPNRSKRREPRRAPSTFLAASRIPPGVAGLVVDADRRQAASRPRRRVRADWRSRSSCIWSPISIVAKFAEIEPDADRGTLVVITGCALLAWSLMMSQAMESVTRAFYARSDLDLILSSPVAVAARVRGADRHHGGLDRADGGAARRALHQHPGLARRRALALRPMAW